MSSVGLVTKPAPSIKTLQSQHGTVVGRAAGRGRQAHGEQGYLWDDIVDELVRELVMIQAIEQVDGQQPDLFHRVQLFGVAGLTPNCPSSPNFMAGLSDDGGQRP